MLSGLAGLLTVLPADWIWSATLNHRPPVDAFFEAVRTVAAVGPASPHGSTAYLMFASFAMLITIVFTAVFTAGMVDRLLAPRQDLGIGVIAVERDPAAPNLRLARALGVPVVIA